MIPTDWLKLESTKIKEVKFLPNVHDDRGDVLVRFSEDKIYRYKDVPSHKVEAMVHSSSPGSYFHANIRGEHVSQPYKDEVQE